MLTAAVNKELQIDNTLIIDDEIDICMLLKTFLKKKSKEVTYSTTLSDGFEKFKDNQPDLLILDHNLPDGKGIDSIKKFKETGDIRKKVYIIVISAMSNLRGKAMENGADHFMEKPISFRKLSEAIPVKS